MKARSSGDDDDDDMIDGQKTEKERLGGRRDEGCHDVNVLVLCFKCLWAVPLVVLHASLTTIHHRYCRLTTRRSCAKCHPHCPSKET